MKELAHQTDQDITDNNRMQNTLAWRRKLQRGKAGKLGEIWVGLTRAEKKMVWIGDNDQR